VERCTWRTKFFYMRSLLFEHLMDLDLPLLHIKFFCYIALNIRHHSVRKSLLLQT
jgi:hypothetical protein